MSLMPQMIDDLAINALVRQKLQAASWGIG